MVVHDRRLAVNADIRERIDALVAAHRRFRRMVWIALTIITVSMLSAVAVGYWQNDARSSEIQSQRRTATLEACRREAGQNSAILNYLRSLGAEEDQIAAAATYFPELTESDCQQRARRLS